MSIETPGDQEERSSAAPGATAAVVADVPEQEEHKGGWSLRDLVRGDLGQWPVFVGLVLIAVYFQIANGCFFIQRNLAGLADQVVSIAVIAVAAVLVLLIGEIDLSLSAVAYFSGAVIGVLSTRDDWPPSRRSSRALWSARSSASSTASLSPSCACLRLLSHWQALSSIRAPDPHPATSNHLVDQRPDHPWHREVQPATYVGIVLPAILLRSTPCP